MAEACRVAAVCHCVSADAGNVRFDRVVAHKFLILAEIGLWYSVCSTIRRITNTKNRKINE